MVLSVLVYLRKNHQTLMLYRNKKKNDLNAGKWIGVGGKIEANESPYEAMLRETFEETNYQVQSARLAGIVTFIDQGEHYEELMFMYVSDDFTGVMKECDEGELRWIDDDQIAGLPMWEADAYFLPWLDDETMHQAKAVYQNGHLVNYREETKKVQ